MDQFPQHSSYTEMKPVWQMCRDAATGQRAIHKGGEKYLDKLEGQSTEQYKKYLRRATFLGATGRTLEAMTGLIFRKAPAIELPTAMESWAQDIDLAGTTLEGMLNKAVTEVGKVGRGGVLVDHPPKRDDLTLEQARALSFRPYAAYYTAENIINWKFQRVGNVTKLAYVCLAENHDDDPDKEQYRELELVDGLYQQNIWRENGEQYDLEVIEPKMNGQRIADIPFFFLAPKEPGQDIQPPPIEPLVYINISHYRNSADLENGAHVSGMPTPYVTGITDDDFVFHLGGAGIALPEGSTAGFLQCGSEGFATLENLMDRKEQQMASLGARLIAPEKKAAETAETTAYKHSGENATLSTIAGSVEQQFQKVLQFMADWAGITGDVRCELNKDYLQSPIGYQDLNALVSAWQQGAMSFDTLWLAMQKGEVAPESVSAEEEQARIAESEPALGTITNDDQ